MIEPVVVHGSSKSAARGETPREKRISRLFAAIQLQANKDWRCDASIRKN